MSYGVKQVILFRKDLNMRKGKVAAQAAHASMKVFFDRNIRFTSPEDTPLDFTGVLIDAPISGAVDPEVPVTLPRGAHLLVPLTPTMAEWVFGTFAKIVLSVEDEATLLSAYELAQKAGLPCAMIEDLGFTEFGGVPTRTAVAIGPAKSADIDRITGPAGMIPTRLA